MFPTFGEAEVYAKKWMSPFGQDHNFETNIPYDYSGYGDIMLIVEIPSAE